MSRCESGDEEAHRTLLGYFLLVALYLAWFEFDANPLVLIVISVLVIIYCLFQAPVPCCAITRENRSCRNNARGLMRGCHLQQHKWQNLKALTRGTIWSRFARSMIRSVSGNAAALSAVAAAVSALAAVVQLIAGTPA